VEKKVVLSLKTYLIYPCGKKFEIRIPILVLDANGKSCSVLPGADNYFEHAKKKFEINNLKVVVEEVADKMPNQPTPFISLHKKLYSVE